MFSCEFCEISKSTFLHRTPLVAPSSDQQFLRNFSGSNKYFSEKINTYINLRTCKRIYESFQPTSINHDELENFVLCLACSFAMFSGKPRPLVFFFLVFNQVQPRILIRKRPQLFFSPSIKKSKFQGVGE